MFRVLRMLEYNSRQQESARAVIFKARDRVDLDVVIDSYENGTVIPSIPGRGFWMVFSGPDDFDGAGGFAHDNLSFTDEMFQDCRTEVQDWYHPDTFKTLNLQAGSPLTRMLDELDQKITACILEHQ